MATYTPNYNLGRPEPIDPIKNFRQLFNDNMDIIDNNMGGGGGGGGDSVTWTQIQQSGTKIAEIEINGVTTDVYAPQGAPPFTALIIITADTGSTITATKGADTYTATEVTTGQYEVTVDSIGMWTISDGTLSDTVTVTAQTTYYVTLSAVPDGRTVLPTDDIQIWLNCANIWDKTYTTLAEVLADTTTLLALINSPNAVDYMVRSTTWASGLTANSTAMSYIGLDNYCANTLLADPTWLNAICNSTYFESVLNVKVPTMTSNTTPSGECFASTHLSGVEPYIAFNGVTTGSWISEENQITNQYVGYSFDSPTKVRKAKIYPTWTSNNHLAVKNWKIEATNDKSGTWTTLTSGTFPDSNVGWQEVNFSNNSNYLHYRLFITDVYAPNTYVMVAEVQFYGREDV